MKYMIKTSVSILLTLSLHAQGIEKIDYNDPDIIIPEYFSSKYESNSIQTTNSSNNELPIIIPDSFKKSQSTDMLSPIVSSSLETNLSNNNSIINDSDTDIAPDQYSGYYKFIKGTDSFQGMFESIDDGFLVIEKLDDNDFGFYYVIQSKKFPPNEKYGIFHYKDGKFFQKFINDPVLRDNVEMKKSDISLETAIATNKGTQAIQWETSSEDWIDTLSPKLQKLLKHSKENYRQIYKDKFTN